MINNEQNNKKTTEGTKILQNYKLSDNIDEDILVDDNTKIDDGKIIKDISDLKENDTITTRFKKGTVTSSIKSIN